MSNLDEGVFFWSVSPSLGAFDAHGNVQITILQVQTCPNHDFVCPDTSKSTLFV